MPEPPTAAERLLAHIDGHIIWGADVRHNVIPYRGGFIAGVTVALRHPEWAAAFAQAIDADPVFADHAALADDLVRAVPLEGAPDAAN